MTLCAQQISNGAPTQAHVGADGRSHSVGPVVVVPHEGVEGPQLHPAHTQFLCGVPPKATYISPGQRHARQAQLQHSWRGEGEDNKQNNIQK